MSDDDADFTWTHKPAPAQKNVFVVSDDDDDDDDGNSNDTAAPGSPPFVWERCVTPSLIDEPPPRTRPRVHVLDSHSHRRIRRRMHDMMKPSDRQFNVVAAPDRGRAELPQRAAAVAAAAPIAQQVALDGTDERTEFNEQIVPMRGAVRPLPPLDHDVHATTLRRGSMMCPTCLLHGQTAHNHLLRRAAVELGAGTTPPTRSVEWTCTPWRLCGLQRQTSTPITVRVECRVEQNVCVVDMQTRVSLQ